jgi:hypothetical protein
MLDSTLFVQRLLLAYVLKVAKAETFVKCLCWCLLRSGCLNYRTLYPICRSKYHRIQ